MLSRGGGSLTTDEIAAWATLVGVLVVVAGFAPWGCRVYREQLRNETADEWWDRQWM